MKKVLAFFVLFLLCTSVHAQSSDIAEQFQSLQVNSSPAYVILGVEPENIQRPNSPKEFAANAQSATLNGKFAPNFAIETTPYFWGKNSRDSTRFNVVDFITNENVGKNFVRSFTFSFATSPVDSTTFGENFSGTAIAIGAHVQLLPGKVSNRVRDNLLIWFYHSRMQVILESIVNKLEGSADARIDDVELWIDDQLERGSLKDLSKLNKESTKDMLMRKIKKDVLVKSDTTYVRQLRDAIKRRSEDKLNAVNEYKFPLTREGFMLELSFANARITNDGSWDNMHNARTSVWLTPSYRFNVNEDPSVIDFIDFMMVARYTNNNNDVDEADYFDAGAKLQWIHQRLSLSAEAIYRYSTKSIEGQDKKYTNRTALTLSYKLNDLITFKTTFGSNFNGTTAEYDNPDPMFIVGGFNFGFSDLLKKD